MEKHQKIMALGSSIMIFCFLFPFIVITVGGPLHDTPPILIITLLIIGFAIIIYGLYKWQMYREQGHIVKDERTVKIFDKSRSYTLYVTMPFICTLGFLFQSEIIKFNIIHFVWLILIQILITQFLFRWYFNKKKDL